MLEATHCDYDVGFEIGLIWDLIMTRKACNNNSPVVMAEGVVAADLADWAEPTWVVEVDYGLEDK